MDTVRKAPKTLALWSMMTAAVTGCGAKIATSVRHAAQEKEILFKEKLVEGLCELVDGYADVEGEMTNGQEWATIRVHGSKEKRPPVRFFLDLGWDQENFYGKLKNNIIIENEEDGSEKEYIFD